jgi:hypothetical protein
MLHAYVQRFDITRNLEKLCKILGTKQGYREASISFDLYNVVIGKLLLYFSIFFSTFVELNQIFGNLHKQFHELQIFYLGVVCYDTSLRLLLDFFMPNHIFHCVFWEIIFFIV